MIRVVLFDIDGTLIQTGGAGVEAFRRAFAEQFGLQEGIETMRFAGRTDTSLVREFFLKHRRTPGEEDYRRFFEAYLAWLGKLLHQLPGGVCPGVPAWLDFLKAHPGRPLVGLLTGNIAAGAELKLRRYGLWEAFSFGAFGNDHEERNELARIALERARQRVDRSLRPEEVLVVGDTPLDIACARFVGARVLAVATGTYPLEELQEHGPCWVSRTLEGLDPRRFFPASAGGGVPQPLL